MNPLYDLQPVPNATFTPARPTSNGKHAQPMWERLQPDGFIHLYPGCTLWRWYVVIEKGQRRDAISPCIYPTAALAMERGQAAYDALLAGGTPVDDTETEI